MAEKPWAEMTADERLASRIEGWRNPEVEFATPEAKATYKARVDRLLAAIELREPDCVPVSITSGWWPAARAGMTPYEAMHDAARGGAGVGGLQPGVPAGRHGQPAPLHDSRLGLRGFGLQALFLAWSWRCQGVQLSVQRERMDAARGIRSSDLRSLGLHAPHVSAPYRWRLRRLRRALLLLRFCRAALRVGSHGRVGLPGDDGWAGKVSLRIP